MLAYDLSEDIHSALRAWHKPSPEKSPLHYLYIFQAIKRDGSSERSATNQVIQRALDELGNNHSKLAVILRSRYLDEKPVNQVAREHHISVSTVHNRQRDGLECLTAIIDDWEKRDRQDIQAKIASRLGLPPACDLVGISVQLNKLLNTSVSANSPWILSIEGIGGIGKTALANALVRELIFTDHFKAIAWVSAKQEEFAPVFGSTKTEKSVLDESTLVDSLLEQLHDEAVFNVSPQEKMVALTELLKSAPYFIVIDNLETVADYEALLPTLRKLVNPSCVLLTSRHSLKMFTDVASFGLEELSQSDTQAFIWQEAKQRKITSLVQASESQINKIHQVVGGNPLALKLVVGQVNLLPLSKVLTRLQDAQGKTSNALYTFIYWEIWKLLCKDSRKLLLRMPLLHKGSLADIIALNADELEPATVEDSLKRFVELSLVQVEGGLEDHQYTIHRLTETFLLKEAIKWQATI